MSKKRVVVGDISDASPSEVAALAQVRPQKLSRVLQAIARSVPGKTLPEEVPEEEDWELFFVEPLVANVGESVSGASAVGGGGRGAHGRDDGGHVGSASHVHEVADPVPQLDVAGPLGRPVISWSKMSRSTRCHVVKDMTDMILKRCADADDVNMCLEGLRRRLAEHFPHLLQSQSDCDVQAICFRN